MATIDLGKIKQVFRGTYDNSTAYAVDDLVVFTDGSVTSTYICTTASTGNNPSSGGTAHANWAFVAKGQAVSPTTTQGDIIVRGASADARLAIGSAGQALKVNSSANGLEYGSAGGVIQTRAKVITAATSINTNTTYVTPSGFTHTITPTSASNHIIVTFNVCFSNKTNHGGMRIIRTVGGTDHTISNSLGDASGSRSRNTSGNTYAGYLDNHAQKVHTFIVIDSDHNTTNQITYSIQHNIYNGTYAVNFNRSYNDDNSSYSHRGISVITLQEVLPTS